MAPGGQSWLRGGGAADRGDFFIFTTETETGWFNYQTWWLNYQNWWFKYHRATVRFHPHVHGDFLASNMWIFLQKKMSITGWWFGTYIIDGI